MTSPALEGLREEMVNLKPKGGMESARPSKKLPGAGMGSVTSRGNSAYKGLEGEKAWCTGN